MKPNALATIADAEKKPDWLRIRVPNGAKYEAVMDIVRSHKLHTVCAESKCPNITECWGRGTATLVLMGSVCTRACKFCAVNTGNPHGWLDPPRTGQRGRCGGADGAEIRGADFGGPR